MVCRCSSSACNNCPNQVQHLIINRWFFLFSPFSSHFSSFFSGLFLGNFAFKLKLKISSNVSMQNRSGSKIETKSTMMALQATLAEKASLRGENEDNDDW